ncbi:MAG: phosphodiesterase [Nocardioidaceae bacterium]|nr:phosphodiesterase [Nocardioidaceae bacterium]
MSDLTPDLLAGIEAAGYHPEAVTDGVASALADESVLDFLVHHEPTFDRDEIRRHVTVVVLTATRLLVGHTDEHPADDLLPTPYTATTTEAVGLDAITSVLVNRLVAQPQAGDVRPGRRGHGQRGHLTAPSEAVLTVSWGAVRHVDLEPASCADPDCEADHGYTGSLTADDFSLRVSATADGGDAVERLLGFARTLSQATARATART